MRPGFFIFCLIIISELSSFAQELPVAIHEFQSLKALESASWSIKIKNLTKNIELISVNSTKSLIPASTLKTITTGIALIELGSQHNYKTYLAHNGDILDSVLSGDLIIISGGDPSLGNPDFYDNNLIQKWVNDLIQKGISKINGNIVLKDDYYSGLITPPTWVYQDLGNYYGASPNSLSYLNNTFRITFAQNPKEGGETKILSPIDQELGLRLINKVVSGPKNSGDQAYVYGCPNCNEYIIIGTIPAGVGTFTIKASNPDPGLFFLNQLKKELIRSDLNFTGDILTNPAVGDYNLLDSQISVPLIQILREINVNSNNLYAEHILLETAKKQNLKNSVEAIEKFYSEKLDPTGLFIADGSGLSRYNSIRTSSHIDFYEHIFNSDLFELYLSTFPEGGKEGTIKNMFKSGNEVQFYAKSGTLSRVKAFTGFIRKSDGDFIAFSFIVNNFEGKSSDISLEMEKVLMSISN